MSKARIAPTCLAGAVLTLVGAVTLSGEIAWAAPSAASSACTTASQSSVKLRTSHKLRQARDEAVRCSAQTCAARVRAACGKRATELNKAIPTIIFQATDSTGHDVSDVKVSMDGESLAAHLDGTALSVDPGQHTFTFEASGRASVDKSLLITEGQKDRHESITVPSPPPPPTPEPVADATPAAADTSAGGDATVAPRRPLRVVGLALGGVGLAGLVVGGVTGGIALSKWHSSESECASPSQCAQHTQAVSDHNTAATLATVSTISFIAGGAALAAGVTLFFLSPKRHEASAPQAAGVEMQPILGPGSGGMALRGVF